MFKENHHKGLLQIIKKGHLRPLVAQIIIFIFFLEKTAELNIVLCITYL